jgi:hypothetical protein
MSYKPTSGSSDPDVPPGKGLRGPDKQQDQERVRRTRDTAGVPAPPAPAATGNVPGCQDTTARDRAQPGADLGASTDFDNEGAPEGLRRERTHPINPHDGRGGVPPHVPGPKDGR